MEFCAIANQHIEAGFNAKGAELCYLRMVHGADLLWDGNPEVWNRTAPVLFPIIGNLPEKKFKHKDKDFHLERHGFARDQFWRLIRLTRESCVWELRDTEETRAVFPFPFHLRMMVSLDGPSLKIAYELRNTGTEPLPGAIGVHPAFRWPLLPDLPKEAHRIEFASEESSPVRRLINGQLDTHPFPNPLDGKTLMLREELFKDDALIFDEIKSRSLRYGVPDGPVIELRWEGFRYLGLWSKPGADFLCIEPWAALPALKGSKSLFDNKSVFPMEAKARRIFSWSVCLI